MNKIEAMEKFLTEYKYNKVRINFLENHLKRLTPEAYNDYIESRMFEPGYSGAAPKFILEGRQEVAQLNKVEETAQEYRQACEREYNKAVAGIEKELKLLRYLTGVVEDTMEMLERVDKRYRTILERYYISHGSMENIAESIHVSRSRCYELSKEALAWAVRIVYGESACTHLAPEDFPAQRNMADGKIRAC